MPACPGVIELDQYVSGQLSIHDSREIAHHVDQCATCQSTLHDLQQNRRVEPMVRALLTEFSQPAEDTDEGDAIGPYKIIRELGRGGSGVVYVARQQNPRRNVAIKVLHHASHELARRKRLMEHEARALARLGHPSIATIYEANCTPDGRFYLAMELVEGLPLTTYARQNNLTLKQKLALFAKIADAVTSAHQRGVIHRDLKPSNILVREDGMPKVLDFGLARLLISDSDSDENPGTLFTEVGHVAGTVPYMSPEQISGATGEVDARSDVYSLGVVLFELLTGEFPYALDPANLAGAARAVCETPPKPPSAFEPQCRGDVDAIVRKALDKDPDRRYASMAEFANDVRRFLRHEPVIAKPAGTFYTLRKFAERQRSLVAVVTISFALLVATAGLAIGQAVAATNERDAAQRRLAYAQQAAAYVLWGVGSQIDYVLGTRDIKRHLAEVAYKYHRLLAAEDHDDPSVQLGLWRAIESLANLSIEIGNIERAQVLINLLDEQLEIIAQVHPDDAVVLRAKASLYHARSRLAQYLDDRAAARQNADDALIIAKTLADRHADSTIRLSSAEAVPRTGPDAGATPPHIADFFSLARAHVRVAELTDPPNEVEAHYQTAMGILDDLMPTDPTLDPIYHEDLSAYAPMAPPILLRVGSRPHYTRLRAVILMGLGRLSKDRGAVDRAEALLKEALGLIDSLSDEDSNSPANVRAQADCHFALAELYRETNEVDSAILYALKARDGYQRLQNGDLLNVEYARLKNQCQFIIETVSPR